MSQKSKVLSLLNEKVRWARTHKFEDGTKTYHYITRDWSVYMVHRDGSATYSPADLEGSYLTAKERDPNSNIPALTTEEIVAEAEAVKEQYREYLDRRGERDILARLFPICDCCDRFDPIFHDEDADVFYSSIDEGYPLY
ncbi:hypothetical protein BJ322DRAFT_1102662 [Thelephora terrestris]|uniref:Uncharacterized protein n=1 Tax=Thelephora terrestris TaxID=56493 RepID=A0A9P6HPI0_9AGAM|nr:hypothetical protein BJ322DRAFT_1102662 [Thelephora terrestris]